MVYIYIKFSLLKRKNSIANTVLCQNLASKSTKSTGFIHDF